MPHPKLRITPIESFVDETVRIQITGCKPYEDITVRAKATDDNGVNFDSCAVFSADIQGKVDLSKTAPTQGSYEGIDASGIVWSMDRTDTKHSDYFTKATATLLPIQISIERKKKTVDSTTLFRKFYDETVKRKPINESGMTGVLYYPDTNNPYPGVLLLGGSDGGMQEHAAALLATKGYTVLTLAYFGAAGVPKDLENIPLEYFKEAALWLKQHPSADGTVSLIGFSRGGELALLLGTTFDLFHAIVAGAPGAYVTSGLRNTVYAPVPSWTHNGTPLPYFKFNHRPKTMLSMGKNWLLRRPVSFLDIWHDSLRNNHGQSSARIQIEKITVPLMTIAGEQDQMWPSAEYARIVEKQLYHNKDKNKYLYYSEAGHFLAFPNALPGMPSNVSMHVGGGMVMDFGGSKQANAKAATETWLHILTFLDKHAKQTDTKTEL